MSDFIPVPKKGNAKECSNYHIIAVISHASKVMLKILQASLQQYVNWELPDVQAGFRKGRRTKDQIANIRWIIGKTREFKEKTPIFASLTTLKPLCGFSPQTVENSSSDRNTRPLASWETCMQIGSNSWNGSKLGKEYVKAVYCHPAYLTYMQSTSC